MNDNIFLTGVLCEQHLVRRILFTEEDDMAPEAQQVKDVVCGMMIDPTTAAAKRTYDGRDFYFCGKGCAKAFDTNPEEYSLEEA